MFGRHIPLTDHVVKLFHRALSFLVDVLSYGTHVVAFLRRMPLTSTLLTRKYLLTPAIVMSLRPTVRTHYLSLSTIVVTIAVDVINSNEWVSRVLSAIHSGSHVHIVSIQLLSAIRSRGHIPFASIRVGGRSASIYV